MAKNPSMQAACQNALLPILADLEKECFFRPWTMKQIAGSLRQEGLLVCLEDASGNCWSSWEAPCTETNARDSLAGFCAVGYAILARAMPREPVELHRLGILPAFQGRGLGTGLLAFSLNEARKAFGDLCRILLEVDERNAPALRLYRKLGFLEIHRRKNYYGAGAALVLEKNYD